MTSNATRTAPPRRSAGASPARVPGSVRRTSTIDVSWPNGRGGNMRLDARARDILTPRSGQSLRVLAEDSYVAELQPDRVIVAIETNPPRPAIGGLIGERGGGGLRQALARVVPRERENATPLYLILDDMAGASLVAGWAWSRWDPNWLTTSRAVLKDFDLEKAFRDRAGICAGFAPGSSGLLVSSDRSGTPTCDLRNPDDPDGWHDFARQESVGLRRARRIDTWLDEVIVIDAAFQDSASTPNGPRAVVHEYSLRATADRVSLQLRSVEATPHVLPFGECTHAAANVKRLLGTPLPALREVVLNELRGTAGCTHLNDAMRALAEVPALICALQGNA